MNNSRTEVKSQL